LELLDFKVVRNIWIFSAEEEDQERHHQSVKKMLYFILIIVLRKSAEAPVLSDRVSSVNAQAIFTPTLQVCTVHKSRGLKNSSDSFLSGIFACNK
jgi:hypothetical protein